MPLLRPMSLGLPPRWWLAALFVLAIAPSLAAQDPLGGDRRLPPAEARDLLRARPDLVQELRQRLLQSGLTAAQVRARLRAAGYPETLLDAYLAGADTTQRVQPAPGTLDAMRSLGILSPAEIDTLARLDSLQQMDDSTRRVVDSLLALRADSLRADSLADSVQLARRELKIFGIEVFRRTTTRFQPTETGPVDDSYRLGPGDELVLILTGDVELAHTLEVTRDGFVVIPQVGRVFAGNLTLGEFRNQLYARLARVYSGVRRGSGAPTQLTLTVARLRNIQVFVVGDVVRPGAYQISGASTPLTALYAAGGPTENGSFRRVEVRRGGRLVDSLDVYDYLVRGNNRSEVTLQSGDVIFVPVRQALVKATGAVARPAVYELKPGETLTDLMAFAGGFEANAVRSRVQIHRIVSAPAGPGVGQARVVVDVGPEQFAGSVVPGVPMSPGDSVTVFEVPERIRGFVTVRGNVWVEGRIGFSPGMKLSEAIRLAGGPKPDVYLERVLVTRVGPDSARYQLRSALRDSLGTVADDLVLQDQDEIQLFSRASFRPQQYVSVVGAVRNPGRVPFREGMTLRDAVLVAGGVTEEALLEEAEIARRDPDNGAGALARSIRVPLDSTVALGTNGHEGGSPADVELRPYDNVLIMRRGEFELPRLVHLGGQVRRPGRYALRSKTERLADLIERAGGLTDEAYPGGIQFWRPRSAITGQPVPRPPRDSAAVPAPIVAGFRERVGVDLPTVLRDARSPDNLILAAGDSIVIPEFDPIVLVQGAVNAPGPVAYTPGKDLDWYVRAAGGYTQVGDTKRAYVTQPDGKKQTVRRRFFLPDGNPEPQPGAEVFVPERIQQEQTTSTTQVLATAAQVLGAITTIVVVLTR